MTAQVDTSVSVDPREEIYKYALRISRERPEQIEDDLEDAAMDQPTFLGSVPMGMTYYAGSSTAWPVMQREGDPAEDAVVMLDLGHGAMVEWIGDLGRRWGNLTVWYEEGIATLNRVQLGPLHEGLSQSLSENDSTIPDVRGATTSQDVVPQAETAHRGLERIKARQSESIQRAKELREEFGDPIARLQAVLASIPVDDDEWDRIIQEPYG